MTNGEKATALLDYLEGLDTRTAINVLNPFLDDDELAYTYDRLVDDGVIQKEVEED
jgi:hypothetical protein